MYCFNCGFKNNESDKFCGNCGKALAAVSRRGQNNYKFIALALAVILLIVLIISFSGREQNKAMVKDDPIPNQIVEQLDWEVGIWQYVGNEGGYDAFYYDLEFYENGIFSVPSPFLMVSSFEYTIDDRYITLRAGAFIEVIEYQREGNTLYLFFDGGYNVYEKIR